MRERVTVVTLSVCHCVCVYVCVCVIQQRISKTTAFRALKRCRDREICKVSPFNVLEFFLFRLSFQEKAS